MDVLEKLTSNRVVSFTLNKNKTAVSVEEQCDDWFGVELDKKEMEQLIQELTNLKNQLP